MLDTDLSVNPREESRRRFLASAAGGAVGTAVLAGLMQPELADAAVTDDGYYNVKASPYGAAGNGSTDDTAAVQSALSDASTNGGTVVFPPGTYKISGTGSGDLECSDKVRILGVGRSSVIKQAGTPTSDVRLFKVLSGATVVFESIVLEGPSAYGTNGQAIGMAPAGLSELSCAMSFSAASRTGSRHGPMMML